MQEEQSATEDRSDENFVRVQAAWTGVDELPVLFVNHFIVQVDEDGFYLTVGQLAPPPLIGTLEERRAQALQIGALTIKPLARYSMPRARAEALAGLLASILEQSRTREESQEK
jgi:hypothetical protein